MPDFEVAEADAIFEDLVAKVEAGEHIVITRDGLPVAQLISVPPPTRSRDGEE
jgi:prevent-host-death family protein